ncbi:MAG: YitT family protein [Spirochaetota bacterium]
MKLYNLGSDILKTLKDLLGIAVGSLICGFAYSLFLIPFKVAPGGVGGLSQILFYKLNISAGISMLIFNIPLFIIGVLFLGRMFGIKTIIAIIFVSIFTDLFSYKNIINIKFFIPYLYQVNNLAYSFTDQILLGTLAGAALLGVGMGIVFRFNGSTGGTDIPALLLKKFLGISVGTGFLIIDSVIIFSIGIVFKNANIILWGFISLFVSSKVTDYVLEGLPGTKGVFIITEHPDVIRQFILKNLDRGCTIFKGEGGYSEKNIDILYVVINLRELTKLKETIVKCDPKAFVIVNDVNEALGYGFKEF